MSKPLLSRLKRLFRRKPKHMIHIAIKGDATQMLEGVRRAQRQINRAQEQVNRLDPNLQDPPHILPESPLHPTAGKSRETGPARSSHDREVSQ